MCKSSLNNRSFCIFFVCCCVNCNYNVLSIDVLNIIHVPNFINSAISTHQFNLRHYLFCYSLFQRIHNILTKNITKDFAFYWTSTDQRNAYCFKCAYAYKHTHKKMHFMAQTCSNLDWSVINNLFRNLLSLKKQLFISKFIKQYLLLMLTLYLAQTLSQTR